MKKISSLVLASTSALVAAGIAAPAFADTTLHIYADEYRPVYFLNENREVSGPAARVILEAAERAGVTVKFDYLPLKRSLSMVEKNANSCFIGLWRTEAREDQYAWAGNIFTDGYAMFAKADSGISLSSVEDSFEYNTGVTAGWGSTDVLKAAGHPKLQEVSDDMLNVKKLDHGRVDLWVSGTLSGPYAGFQQDVEVTQVLALEEIPLDLACNLGTAPEAVSGMAAAMDEMRAEGRVQELLDQLN